MNTTSFYRIAVASTVSALTLAFATSAVPAQASSAIDVQDWAVFVDPPTRFAFVKTPNGWVFVRQLDEEQMIPFSATTNVGRDDLAAAVVSLVDQPSWRDDATGALTGEKEGVSPPGTP